jgi:hypothetical protein
MWLLRIAIMLASAQLWRMGGDGQKWARRYVLPGVLSIFLALFLQTWWLFPACFATMQIYAIGYGEDSWLWKISGGRGWLARGLAGLLYGVLGSLPVFIVTHDWMLYAIYSISNFAIGAILSYYKVKDVIIERVIGGVVGTIVFYV